MTCDISTFRLLTLCHFDVEHAALYACGEGIHSRFASDAIIVTTERWNIGVNAWLRTVGWQTFLKDRRRDGNPHLWFSFARCVCALLDTTGQIWARQSLVRLSVLTTADCWFRCCYLQMGHRHPLMPAFVLQIGAVIWRSIARQNDVAFAQSS